MEGRLFTDTELRYLSDAVNFSTGISESESGQVIEKIQKLYSRHFGSWFEYVKYSDMDKRTDREELFAKLEIVDHALKMKRKLTFRYRKNDIFRAATSVSPYYLVISVNVYY